MNPTVRAASSVQQRKIPELLVLSALNITGDACVIFPGSGCNSAQEITGSKQPVEAPGLLHSPESSQRFRSNFCKIKPGPEHPLEGREASCLVSWHFAFYSLAKTGTKVENKSALCTSVVVAAAQAGAYRSPTRPGFADSGDGERWDTLAWTWECLCELKPSSGAFGGLSVSNADIKCASPHQSAVEAADFLLRKTRENRFSMCVVYFNMFLVFDWFSFFWKQSWGGWFVLSGNED